MNTTFMSGVPMTAPSGVYLLRDPSLPDPTWDHMFNTGTVQPNGQIVNQVDNLPPAFAIQPANTLRTASQIPGVEVQIMKHVGHFPMSEHPAKFREYILPVLAKIS